MAVAFRTEVMFHPVVGADVEFIPVAELRRKVAPMVLPLHWHVGKKTDPLIGDDAIWWTYEPPFNQSLKVIMTAGREADGRLWLHVSVSKWDISKTKNLLPDWDDLRLVKDLFIGKNRKSIAVLPPETEHVNIRHVHHLWTCLDEDVLPDFTRGTGSI